jgi:hypothetical protein
MKELKELRRWLKQPGNSPAKLAARLGYRSSTTISKWLERGMIPERMLAPLRAALNEQGEAK